MLRLGSNRLPLSDSDNGKVYQFPDGTGTTAIFFMQV